MTPAIQVNNGIGLAIQTEFWKKSKLNEQAGGLTAIVQSLNNMGCRLLATTGAGEFEVIAAGDCKPVDDVDIQPCKMNDDSVSDRTYLFPWEHAALFYYHTKYQLNPNSMDNHQHYVNNNDRLDAVQGIASLGTEESISELRDTLTDSNHRIVLSAIQALGSIGQSAFPTLIETLEQGDVSPSARQYAAMELARVGDPTIKSALQEVLRRNPNMYWVSHALVQLGDIEGAVAFERLEG